MHASTIAALTVLSAVLAAGCASPGFQARSITPSGAVGPGPRAVVVVRVARPWYAPRFVVRGKFHDVLPEYEAIAELQAKYFTISDDGEFGGIYLWDRRLDAERHFDAAWRADVRARRGVDAAVTIEDAPFVIEGRALPRGKPEGARSLDYPAWASAVSWTLPADAEVTERASALAAAPWSSDALIRAFVVTGARSVGVVSLWATRDAAELAVDARARSDQGRALGATGSAFTLFEAPLLVDATLRGH